MWILIVVLAWIGVNVVFVIAVVTYTRRRSGRRAELYVVRRTASSDERSSEDTGGTTVRCTPRALPGSAEHRGPSSATGTTCDAHVRTEPCRTSARDECDRAVWTVGRQGPRNP